MSWKHRVHDEFGTHIVSRSSESKHPMDLAIYDDISTDYPPKGPMFDDYTKEDKPLKEKVIGNQVFHIGNDLLVKFTKRIPPHSSIVSLQIYNESDQECTVDLTTGTARQPLARVTLGPMGVHIPTLPDPLHTATGQINIIRGPAVPITVAVFYKHEPA